MKDFLLNMAFYNQSANEKMLLIIDSLHEDFYKKDMKVYYKNILGIIFHIAWAEILWLKRYKTFFKYPVLENSTVVSLDISEIRKKYNENFMECKGLLKESDLILSTFIEDINENDLFKRVKYNNIKGEEQDRIYWATIFQVLNHGTHHRGEISAILDINGIENDYASFLSYIK